MKNCMLNYHGDYIYNGSIRGAANRLLELGEDLETSVDWSDAEIESLEIIAATPEDRINGAHYLMMESIVDRSECGLGVDLYEVTQQAA